MNNKKAKTLFKDKDVIFFLEKRKKIMYSKCNTLNLVHECTHIDICCMVLNDVFKIV